jgi:hypothetical protein
MILALSLLIMAGCVIVPPLAVWLVVKPRAQRSFEAGRRVLAVVGPSLAAMPMLVLLWSTQFDGRCGGMTGETHACGFARYVAESVFVALLSLMSPALLGMLAGSVTLLMMRRRSARKA